MIHSKDKIFKISKFDPSKKHLTGDPRVSRKCPAIPTKLQWRVGVRRPSAQTQDFIKLMLRPPLHLIYYLAYFILVVINYSNFLFRYLQIIWKNTHNISKFTHLQEIISPNSAMIHQQFPHGRNNQGTLPSNLIRLVERHTRNQSMPSSWWNKKTSKWIRSRSDNCGGPEGIR